MNLSIIIPLVIYLILVFASALYAYSKRQQGDFLTEYYIGNRTMKGFVLAMTMAATYIGASSIIGGPGGAYKYGLGWVLLAMIQVPVLLLVLGVLGKKLAIASREHNLITISDLLLQRYKSKTLVLVASLSLLTALFAGMVVQFIGGARLLEGTIGINYTQALLIFALTVGVYTFIGGFRAVVLTDTIQGSVMILGTLLLLGGVIYAAGGVESAVTKLIEIDPDLVTPQGPNDKLGFTFMTSFWVLVCFGIIGLPQTAIRGFAFKDSKALHRGIVIGTLVVALVMMTIHLAGALGRAVLPDLTVPDKVIPTLMLHVLHPVVAGIFLATPMAAIMSTLDSHLLQSSSIFIKDLYLSINPNAIKDQRKLKLFSTAMTLILTVLVVVMAYNPPDMLIWLNLLALGGLESAFLWVLVLGLFWEKANAHGAITSMIVGVGVYVFFTVTGIKIFEFHQIVPSLVISLIAFLIGNKFGENSPHFK